MNAREHWGWCGAVAVRLDGETHRVGSPVELAIWYSGLPRNAVVWTWEAAGEELLALTTARPGQRFTGAIGAGVLLALRAKGHAQVRDASALLPWLYPPDGCDHERAAYLVGMVAAELDELRHRGYVIDGRQGPRLTLGAVAWATACAVCDVAPTEPVTWGEYDAGHLAYFGGRCEVGAVAAPYVSGWDISGAYPWALLQDVPTGRRVGMVGTAARRAYERGQPGAYLARCFQPRGDVSNLPYRHSPNTGHGRKRGPLLWVTGHVQGWWVGGELEAAERHGTRVEIVAAQVWETAAPVWAPYLEHTAADRAMLRAQGRDEESAKLLANALSGKLAQGVQSTTLRVLADDEEPELGWSWHGSRVWSKPHRSVPSCARPIEAATVTARVRGVLLDEMHRLDGSWVYCDTDSIWHARTHETPEAPGGPAPWHVVDHGREWQSPKPKTYRYRGSDGSVTVRASGVHRSNHATITSFAAGEPSLRRALPYYPPMPTGLARWAGTRRIKEGGRTYPLHMDQHGELT